LIILLSRTQSGFGRIEIVGNRVTQETGDRFVAFTGRGKSALDEGPIDRGDEIRRWGVDGALGGQASFCGYHQVEDDVPFRVLVERVGGEDGQHQG
jgi:hypothetical protein